MGEIVQNVLPRRGHEIPLGVAGRPGHGVEVDVIQRGDEGSVQAIFAREVRRQLDGGIWKGQQRVREFHAISECWQGPGVQRTRPVRFTYPFFFAAAITPA